MIKQGQRSLPRLRHFRFTRDSNEERARVSEAHPSSPTGDDSEEHFRPIGTVFVLVMFVAALVLLWLSVYIILLSRGVTT